MIDQSATAPLSAPLRVGYLLADAGIPFSNSKKGSSIHARSMIKALQQEGCRVETYVFRKGDRPLKGFNVIQVRVGKFTNWWQRRLIDQGLWRRAAPWRPAAAGPPNWMIATSWLLWHRDFMRFVRHRFSKEGPPELLYARSAWLAFPYARLKRLTGAPLVLEVNAVMTIEKESRGELAFAGLTRRIEGAMFRAADLILPVSAEIKEQIVARFGIPAERIVVTPNAVDLELFRPPENGAGPREGEFVIGAVNSFRAYHGMGTLARAAARLKGTIPGLRLLLIGAGPQFEQIRREAQELGIGEITEFSGIADHQRVPELLGRCAVCAAPYEGEANQYNCPMKLYEYMGMKIPIVASRWGDIPNIVTHGRTALLHEAGDAASLAEAILEVWRDPEGARRRAEEAFLLARQHTWRASARMILDWHASRSRSGGSQ